MRNIFIVPAIQHGCSAKPLYFGTMMTESSENFCFNTFLLICYWIAIEPFQNNPVAMLSLIKRIYESIIEVIA